MKFVWMWLPIFVFKKSLSKVNNTVSKVTIFSTGDSSEDEKHFILYKKTCINALTLVEYLILYKSEINFHNALMCLLGWTQEIVLKINN